LSFRQACSCAMMPMFPNGDTYDRHALSHRLCPFPGMTQLDFTGPHQFLSRMPNSQTIVASRDGGEVAAEGLVFAHTWRLSEIEGCDLICVPGGVAATQVALDQEFVAQVRRLGLGARYVTSVCTGSLILGRPVCCRKAGRVPLGLAASAALVWRDAGYRPCRARRACNHRRGRNGGDRFCLDGFGRIGRGGCGAVAAIGAGICAVSAL
jgi:hypothetical protein